MPKKNETLLFLILILGSGIFGVIFNTTIVFSHIGLSGSIVFIGMAGIFLLFYKRVNKENLHETGHLICGIVACGTVGVLTILTNIELLIIALGLWDLAIYFAMVIWNRNPQVIKKMLRNIAENLELPRVVTEEAERIFEKGRQARLTKERAIDSLVTASLYAAIKIHRLPRTLNELSEVSNIPANTIARVYRLLAEYIEGARLKEAADPITESVERFGQNLNLSQAVRKLAIEILSHAKNSGMVFDGKSPKGLASAALYLAAEELEEPRSQTEISETFAISEVNLRKRVNQLRKRFDERRPNLDNN